MRRYLQRTVWQSTRAPIAYGAALWLLAALPARAACPGDCDGSGQVAVNELVTAVGIALGEQPLEACLTADVGGDGDVGVAELVAAVNSALAGCPADVTPTAPATVEPTTIGATQEARTPTATGVPLTATRTVLSSTATPEPPPATATVGPPTPTRTAVPSTATTTPTPAPAPTTAGDQDPPTSGGPLRDWLAAGSYLGWAAESAPHQSAGPHGTVRVFVNDRLRHSLEGGLASHPSGAAAVKELYGGGDELMGWSVSVKVQDDSDGGRGWYWFERFNTSQFADGRGVAGCTGCHSAGRDFVRIPFPLR